MIFVDVNEVFLSRFENGDRVGQIINDNGDNLDWQTTNNKMKPVTGPMKDASEDSTKGAIQTITHIAPNNIPFYNYVDCWELFTTSEKG